MHLLLCPCCFAPAASPLLLRPDACLAADTLGWVMTVNTTKRHLLIGVYTGDVNKGGRLKTFMLAINYG